MDSDETIYIIDDDESVRNSLQILLTANGYHVKTYPCCEEYLAQYDSSGLGCLILDIKLPRMDGLELLSILASRNNLIPTIVVTGHGDVPMAVEALTKGAINFIQKPYRDYDLLGSVKKAIQISQENHARNVLRKNVKEIIKSLSHMESQTLPLVVEGFSNKQISMQFGVTLRAVSYHRQALLEKFNVSNTVKLATIVKPFLNTY